MQTELLPPASACSSSLCLTHLRHVVNSNCVRLIEGRQPNPVPVHSQSAVSPQSGGGIAHPSSDKLMATARSQSRQRQATCPCLLLLPLQSALPGCQTGLSDAKLESKSPLRLWLAGRRCRWIGEGAEGGAEAGAAGGESRHLSKSPLPSSVYVS